MIERKRRERINESLNQLKALVLEALKKDVSIVERGQTLGISSQPTHGSFVERWMEKNVVYSFDFNGIRQMALLVRHKIRKMDALRLEWFLQNQHLNNLLLYK